MINKDDLSFPTRITVSTKKLPIPFAINKQTPGIKSEFRGEKIQGLEGASLLPVFATGTRAQPDWFFWEQYNNKAVRHANWKAVQPAEAGSPWELYDLAADPTELHDRASRDQTTLHKLTAAWQQWAHSHNVLPKKEG